MWKSYFFQLTGLVFILLVFSIAMGSNTDISTCVVHGTLFLLFCFAYGPAVNRGKGKMQSLRLRVTKFSSVRWFKNHFKNFHLFKVKAVKAKCNI